MASNAGDAKSRADHDRIGRGPITLGWWGWAVVGRLAVVIVAATAVAMLGYAWLIGPNPWRDGDAYLNAALRIRTAQPLYPELGDYGGATVYRYAPWFAFAWVPLSYLPRELVIGIWQAAMLACSALAVLPAWRAGLLGRAIAVIVAPFLVMASLLGNVQPAIVALLVYSVRGRAGPLAIGLTASLKLVPMLYVVTFLARRQWRAACVAFGLAVLLWAPAVLVGIDHYPAAIGETTGLWTFSPLLWGVAIAALVVVAYLTARRPEGWYASSLLVALGTPRFIAYDWTFLLVGPGRNADARGRSRPGNRLPFIQQRLLGRDQPAPGDEEEGHVVRQEPGHGEDHER